jgi:hypothetical protein
VNGHPATAELLRCIEHFYRRFLAALADEHFAILAVWTLHTWAIDAASATAYLHVTAPEKESGKTRVLEVAALLTNRPRMAVNLSAAALYHELDAGLTVTLLLDEVDNFLAGAQQRHREVLGILNSGYTRSGGRVGRVMSTGVRYFNVFGPKMLTGIGQLPDTLASRALRLPIARRKPSETVERLRARTAEPEAARLRAVLQAWTQIPGVLDALANATPTRLVVPLRT